jgi:hypothetical protein
LWWGYPTPRCFYVKSAESLEKKRVEFFANAKKCKRVRNNVKRKNLNETRVTRRQPGQIFPKWEQYPHTSVFFVSVASKKFNKSVSLLLVILVGMAISVAA